MQCLPRFQPQRSLPFNVCLLLLLRLRQHVDEKFYINKVIEKYFSFHLQPFQTLVCEPLQKTCDNPVYPVLLILSVQTDIICPQQEVVEINQLLLPSALLKSDIPVISSLITFVMNHCVTSVLITAIIRAQLKKHDFKDQRQIQLLENIFAGLHDHQSSSSLLKTSIN